jgi:hypothetical protein
LLDTDPTGAAPKDRRPANIRIASASYFDTLSLTPRAGRLLTAADRESMPVAVVNEAFVAAHLGGGPAIGRRIRVVLDGGTPETVPLRTIVGVYPDIKERTLYQPTPPTVYLPVDARDATRMAIVIKTRPSAWRNDTARSSRDFDGRRRSGRVRIHEPCRSDGQ